MMRGLGILMLVVGTVFMFALPYYQQHFTNFTITEQQISSAGEDETSFQVELATNDAPLAISIVSSFALGAIEPTASMTVPMAINGPTGSVLATLFNVTTDGFNADDNPAVGMSTHRYFVRDIDVPSAGIYTVTVGPLINDGLSAEAIELTLRGRAVAPWPNLDALSWALIAVGGFAVWFGGGRKTKHKQRSKTSSIGRRPPAQPPQPDKPKQKWGRDT